MNLFKIKKGDIVDVISPATACNKEEILQIKNLLKENGLRANIFFEKETTLSKKQDHEFSSFAAKDRFLQFKNSVENSNSKIVWCSRGGYGSDEILSFLEKMPKPKNKKIFIGFSDISSLNKILIEKWNWQVVSAPVLVQMTYKKVLENSQKAIFDLIFGKTKLLKYQLISLNKLPVKLKPTIVTGGCISVLSGSFGTKNQLDWKNKILFLEDEGESGERLDRYFKQIISIILEQKKFPAAIILGNFLESNPHGSVKAKNIEIAFEKFAKNLTEKNIKIPLLLEKSHCLGHSKNMLPLILGKEIEINGKLELLQKI